MCTTTTRDKIKGLKDFAVLDRAGEFHALIKVIKSTTLQFELHKDLTTALMRYHKGIMDCKQGPDVSLIKYKQKFLTLLSTYKANGGSLALPAIIKRDVAKADYC